MGANAALKEIDRRNRAAREEGIGLEDAIEQRAEEILGSGDYEALIQEASSSRAMQDACKRIATRQRGRLSSDEVLIALALRNAALTEAQEQIVGVRR